MSWSAFSPVILLHENQRQNSVDGSKKNSFTPCLQVSYYLCLALAGLVGWLYFWLQVIWAGFQTVG